MAYEPESTSSAKHPSRQSGSALILALLIMVIMTLLGLAFALMGQTEARIALNGRDGAQALFAAEGGVRLVKKWFEAPSGTSSYLVPTVSQMDRTLRWIDQDSDGTYISYSSAPAPWNVSYKQGTDDPFEKPYRGRAENYLMGTEDHPDVRISETGSSNEQAFLDGINTTLFPAFPSTIQRVRVSQIDVYGPPILLVGTNRVRGGMATIRVTAGVYENAGTAQERRIATKVVKAVISELPYRPSGAIQSCVNLDISGTFDAHWGPVTTVGLMNLNSNLDVKVHSSIPSILNQRRMIARDMDLNGTLQTGTPGFPTPDDLDGDGTLDFDNWMSGPDVEDPWLRFWSEGDIQSNGKSIAPGCSTQECQPAPWFQGPSTFGSGTNDHSNLFKNVPVDLCPQFDYEFWKQIALTDAPNVRYYTSDGPGTGTYRLNGSGAPIGFEAATNNATGLFFFDSADNSKPVDADANGTYDNLADDITISGGGWTTGGFIFVNANFNTTGSGSVSAARTLIAPAEPYIDSNANGAYDDDEWFIDLDYPASVTGGYNVNGIHRVMDGYTRQDPARDAAPDGKYSADINVYGVMYSTGMLEAEGNYIIFGSMVTKGGQPSPGFAGTPQYFYDERLVKGMWPPPELGLPRTYVTAWQTE